MKKCWKVSSGANHKLNEIHAFIQGLDPQAGYLIIHNISSINTCIHSRYVV